MLNYKKQKRCGLFFSTAPLLYNISLAQASGICQSFIEHFHLKMQN